MNHSTYRLAVFQAVLHRGSTQEFHYEDLELIPVYASLLVLLIGLVIAGGMLAYGLPYQSLSLIVTYICIIHLGY